MNDGYYIKKRLEESQVINLILDKVKCSNGNLDVFYEVTNVPRTEELNFDRFYITRELLRENLGLNKGLKPGDIDILIIPGYKDRVYFEFTSAFEVKIVRPTNKNIRKNSNSLGTTQISGMINDGFPLVGLIHICMNEPVLKEHIQYLPNLDNLSEIFTYDPFPIYSIETQYERILKTDLPMYVGLNIFGLSFNENYKEIIQKSSKFQSFERGYFNPKVKSELIKNIKDHFEENKEEYIVKLNNDFDN